MNTYSCAFNCVKCFVILKNNFLHYYHPFHKSHVSPYLDASLINIPCLECLKHNIEGEYYDDENRPFHVTKSVVNDKLATKTYYFLSDAKQQKIVPCDYEFLNITLIYKNETYDINISANQHNFLCVNQKLNHLFFKWFMKSWYNITLNGVYGVSIIDNNCNMFDLDCGKTITLLKEHYIIN